MKKHSFVLSIILLALCSCFLFGNGNKETTPSSDAKTVKQPLTMWFWGAATPYQETMKDVLMGWYNGSQDKYELNIEFRNTVDKDIPVALASGAGPDIVYASGPSYTSVYVQENLVKDLTPYAEQYGWKDRVLSVMYNACTVNGKLYSVPGGMCIGGLYYNKSLFAEKGWKAPETWDEMMDLFEKAKAAGLYPLGAGNKGWKPYNDHFGSMVVNHIGGGKLFYDALVGKTSFDTPAMEAAVTESAEWYKKGYLAGNDYKSKFLEEEIKYSIAKGLIYPVLGAFRAILKEQNGVYMWASDPFQMMDEVGPTLVTSVIERSRTLGNNPNAVGKDVQQWMTLYQTVLIKKLMKGVN